MVSCVPHGMYVLLDNSCEGLVKMDSLPWQDYYYDEKFSIKREGGGEQFTVGKRIKIRVTAADVSSGEQYGWIETYDGDWFNPTIE